MDVKKELIFGYNVIVAIIFATIGEFAIIASALFLTIRFNEVGFDMPTWNWTIIVLGLSAGVLAKWMSEKINEISASYY
jgi:hypothetical protein